MHTGFLAVPALFSALRWQKTRLQNQWERWCAQRYDPSTRVQRAADNSEREGGMLKGHLELVLTTRPASVYVPHSTESLPVL